MQLSLRIGRDRREIDRLPSNHADGAGRMRDGLDDAQLAGDDEGIATRGRACEEMKRLGQQSVARQDGHAFSGDDVQRGPAASHGVVVHRGQVVVDERVGVNQFDGARRWAEPGCGRHRQRLRSPGRE